MVTVCTLFAAIAFSPPVEQASCLFAPLPVRALACSRPETRFFQKTGFLG